LASEVAWKRSAIRDLKRLDPPVARRIFDRTETALAEDPDGGKPLSGQFKGLHRLRVGEHRVIYTLTASGALVLRVAKRSRAYR